jgi:hypothetical protein
MYTTKSLKVRPFPNSLYSTHRYFLLEIGAGASYKKGEVTFQRSEVTIGLKIEGMDIYPILF